MVHTARHWLLGFLPGALLFAYGLFQIIGKEAWLGPTAGLTGSVLAYLLAMGGLFMILDSFFEYAFHSGVFITTFIIGIVVFALGLVNVLNQFGVVTFQVPLAAIFYHILFVLEGIFLIIATFVMD